MTTLFIRNKIERVVCMILLFIAVICGILASLLGAGSSLMAVPLLEYVYPLISGQSLTTGAIISSALMLTLFSTGAASLRHHHLKTIHFRSYVLYALSGSIGSFLSAFYLSENVNQLLFLTLFVIIALCSLLFNLIPIKKKSQTNQSRLYKWLTITILFFLGVITGIIGVGGMVLIVPYMIYVLHHTLKETVAITTFIGFFIALFAILGRASIGLMDWQVSFVLGIGGFLGGFIAPSFSKYIPDLVLKICLNLLLVVIIMIVCLDLLQFL